MQRSEQLEKEAGEIILRRKYDEEYGNKAKNLQNELNQEFVQKNKAISANEQQLKTRETALKNKEKAFEILISQKTKGFPLLGEAWADYLGLLDTNKANALDKKKNPAPKSADVVREIRSEKRNLIRENKVLHYTIRLYESLFPWLSDFKEEGIDELIEDIRMDTHSDDEDMAHQWLSPGEYSNLSTIDKFQRALDRYLKSRSKPWQIGRDYERYIGYNYEQQGYSVHYHGIVEGLNDLGRDLICKNKKETLIVQCKCWSKTKTIHEKHINQLFGTMIMYKIQNPKENVKAVFVSSTTLSPTARKFADILGVTVMDSKSYDKTYPIIKCNVNKRDGTKIYHLPFDQQYDNVVITPPGECYVRTVAEAENLGFRRAYRWHPDK